MSVSRVGDGLSSTFNGGFAQNFTSASAVHWYDCFFLKHWLTSAFYKVV